MRIQKATGGSIYGCAGDAAALGGIPGNRAVSNPEIVCDEKVAND